MMSDKKLVKVGFDLIQDDGYPPISTEWLWSCRQNEIYFQIDNVPFFAVGVAVDDVVEARINDDGDLKYVKHHSRSGHATLRLLFVDEHLVGNVMQQIGSLGGFSEQSHISSLIAVDIPDAKDANELRNLIYDGEKAGKWEIEEACIWW
ncbi:DUF4265 domain-containing protein [Labrys sp. KB_33_2]|uniref:DUF4265 domain-containing protein n=1 Tax=Labrys sp. KB_33_2 TaxID=3237479 RepID=UPI003F8FB6C3